MMNETMLAGMREAMAVLRKDGPGAATATIQQTLRGLMPAGAPGASRQPGEAASWSAEFVPDLLTKLSVIAPIQGTRGDGLDGALLPREPGEDRDAAAPGHFLAGSFANEVGKRAYKLYVPSAYQGQALPLVVMLHGCSQTPDDFAAGTRFNEVAEEQPCFVLYPSQARTANITRCWNWFNTADQQRDQGEPSLIAGMTREIMGSYSIDPDRIYIAGLSAGGAMAVVMAATYPELYAAVGVHSGVPYAAANDMASAFAAMQGEGTPVANASLKGIPIIAFHGDRDQTVHPRNSDRIIGQARSHLAAAHVKKGHAGAGYAYTQTVHQGPDGRVVGEHWLVHGAGHAWSGGSARGSFTDAQGPDASREMMRFFLGQANLPV